MRILLTTFDSFMLWIYNVNLLVLPMAFLNGLPYYIYNVKRMPTTTTNIINNNTHLFVQQTDKLWYTNQNTKNKRIEHLKKEAKHEKKEITRIGKYYEFFVVLYFMCFFLLLLYSHLLQIYCTKHCGMQLITV